MYYIKSLYYFISPYLRSCINEKICFRCYSLFRLYHFINSTITIKTKAKRTIESQNCLESTIYNVKKVVSLFILIWMTTAVSQYFEDIAWSCCICSDTASKL